MPLLLAYRCGMRLGEIFGLMWNDIDFAKGILSVNRQVQNHNDKWYLENPKYDSFRTIELDDITLSELKDCTNMKRNVNSTIMNTTIISTVKHLRMTLRDLLMNRLANQYIWCL